MKPEPRGAAKKLSAWSRFRRTRQDVRTGQALRQKAMERSRPVAIRTADNDGGCPRIGSRDPSLEVESCLRFDCLQ